MSRFLFCVIPEKGHINPSIGPALHLQAHGHTVAFCCAADIQTSLAPVGLGQLPVASTAAISTPRGADFAAAVGNPEWLRAWIIEMLLGGLDTQVTQYQAQFAAFKPDVIALDPMLYPAVIAAHTGGYPWAVVSNSLNPVLPSSMQSELLATVESLSAQRQVAFARWGMQPRFKGCDVWSPHLTVAFTTAALVGPQTEVQLVGPSIPKGLRGDEPEFDWRQLDASLPLIYMSLGSQIFYQPEAFRNVIAAFAEQKVQLLLSVGSLQLAELGIDIPANVCAVAYAPQLQILNKAALFITHGGANSVMEALAAGVPMLVWPICNDQFHNAHFVQQSGAGLVVDLLHETAGQIRELAAALQTNPWHIACLARIHKSYQQADGALNVAHALSKLASITPT